MTSAAESIRPYRSGDGAGLSRMLRQSVAVLGPRRYSPEQVEAWLSLLPDGQAIAAHYDGGRFARVAEASAGALDGLIDLEDRRDAGEGPHAGHIGMLYVAPLAAGRGLAGALCDAVEAEAVRRGLGRLTVDASEVARGLFARRGYICLGRRERLVRGVAIHNFAMARDL